MRILQICNKFPYPPRDGGVIATFSMLKGFYLAKNNVTVATINTTKHYTNPSTLPVDVAKMAQFNDVIVETNLTIIDALKNLLFSKLPYTASRFISKEFKEKLIQVLQSQTFDVIQLEGLYVCPYIPLLHKYSQAKIVYRAHNVEFEIWERLWKETNFLPKKWYLHNLAKRVKEFELSMINTYDLLVPITQRDADFYTKLGNVKPIFVVPTGIFTDMYSPVISSANPISLFHIGGLDWAPNQQGLEWFIQHCWPKIYSEFSSLRFRIAGRNAPERFIQNISVPGVDFVGEVADARDFMEQNTIMIVPLLAGSGMRIKIIEGLAYGKAIVSTSIGAEGIDAKHTVEICIANSENEFIQAITQLIKNNEMRFMIEKNAVTFVSEKFNNSQIISRLLNFYKNHGVNY